MTRDATSDRALNKRALIRDLLIDNVKRRVGLREVNIWRDTVLAWVAQGYPTEPGPDGPVPVDWRDHFGYDMVVVAAPFDSLPLRDYREVVDETDEWVIVRVKGNLNEILEQALAEAFDEIERPDLYEKTLEERERDKGQS